MHPARSACGTWRRRGWPCARGSTSARGVRGARRFDKRRPRASITACGRS
jgi:hypothetical protein